MDTKKLRQKILDLAIRGKLVPQDPNDEPASVLLERIKAEKEQLIKEGKIKRGKKSESADKSHYENVPFEIPESWVWCSLNDICHIFGRIGFRGYTKEDLVHSGGAITLSPSNIINGKMSYDNCTYISWAKYEESPEIQISNDDILLVKTGSSYGKCALVTELPQAATINPQFVVLKYISCDSSLLRYILQSDYAKYNYEQFVLGTAIPTFTQSILGNMMIPLPPLQEQQRIVTELEKWFEIINKIENGASELETYIKLSKSKILNLAVSGKLIPQDPNDEPATELLKRINPSFKSCDNSHYENLPNGWTKTEFKDIFKTIPIRDCQIQQRDIANKGEYPVISQSLNYIEGYSNRKDKVLEINKPVIVFGDHTRIVKYIDFPFIIGADGVKVIETNIDAKYAYYLLLNASSIIENKGYSRHFQFLSKYQYIIPPLAEQKRIIKALDDIYNLLDKIVSRLT